MKIIDNIKELLKDDLTAIMQKNSEVVVEEIFKLYAPNTRVRSYSGEKNAYE
ncbi:MAG: hypothetical protein ACOH15_11580 [Acetobacterium sp.]